MYGSLKDKWVKAYLLRPILSRSILPPSVGKKKVVVRLKMFRSTKRIGEIVPFSKKGKLSTL